MTQEEKQLLLADLSARLPYGVKVNFRSNIEVLCEVHIYQSVQTVVGESGILYDADMPNVKPYLRPMSTMTEEEKMQLKEEHLKDARLFAEALTKAAEGDNSMRGKVIPHFAADWCYKNHFDFRGLIPMGLALEAPSDMYKTE